MPRPLTIERHVTGQMLVATAVCLIDYGHSHGVIGRTLMETAGEHVAILYNSADGRFVCVMLLATSSFPERNAAHSDHFA